MGKHFFSLLLCLGLAACAPTPTPTPTKSTLRVTTTPALESLVTHWATEYMDRQDMVRIDLRVLPIEDALDAAGGRTTDVIVASTQPPRGWFATPLFVEGIAVVVHPANRVQSLDREDLAGLFSGAIDTWSELGGEDLPVQPVIPLPSDESREYFIFQVLDGGGFSPDAFIAPSPLAMVAMVSEYEGAIGFLPLSQAADMVRIVRLDGILPQSGTVDDGRYPLHIEILALAPEQPSGAAYDWLAWLQASLSIDNP